MPKSLDEASLSENGLHVDHHIADARASQLIIHLRGLPVHWMWYDIIISSLIILTYFEDDGTLRVYSLSGQRNVLKAVRGLGSEVSSIACIPGAGSKIPDVWLACGTRVSILHMSSIAISAHVDRFCTSPWNRQK